jgi:hypothetical protein
MVDSVILCRSILISLYFHLLNNKEPASLVSLESSTSATRGGSIPAGSM